MTFDPIPPALPALVGCAPIPLRLDRAGFRPHRFEQQLRLVGEPGRDIGDSGPGDTAVARGTTTAA
ncbi:hypothetical protein GCM10009087_43040 [Sphingomonas oligophenolica]